MADPAGDFRALAGSPPARSPGSRRSSYTGRQASIAKQSSTAGSAANAGTAWSNVSPRFEAKPEDVQTSSTTEEYNEERVAEMLNSGSAQKQRTLVEPSSTPRKVLNANKQKLAEFGGASFVLRGIAAQEGTDGGDTGGISNSKLLEFKDSIEGSMRQNLTELEQRYEKILEGMAECLTEELMGVQESLSLLQEQVDTHKNMLQKAIPDIQQKLNEEKTSRSFVQRSLRESKSQLAEHIAHMNKAMTEVRLRLDFLENQQNKTFWGILADIFCCCCRRKQVYQSTPMWEIE